MDSLSTHILAKEVVDPVHNEAPACDSMSSAVITFVELCSAAYKCAVPFKTLVFQLVRTINRKGAIVSMVGAVAMYIRMLTSSVAVGDVIFMST